MLHILYDHMQVKNAKKLTSLILNYYTFFTFNFTDMDLTFSLL